MPRANRHFLPGYVWHITHRCHRKAFLLKFARDRRRYLRWLFEAKKRYGLRVLNYAVTSNHIHLLVKDTGVDVIPRSMQLVAGRTGQEFMLENFDSGCSKRSQMRGVREVDERRRTWQYVEARRSSATTQVSLFHSL
jgi:REP element-mobilizing transposase RayT